MTAEAAPELALVVASELWPGQISQIQCALCRRDMTPLRETRSLGEVEVGEGIYRRKVELWACAPTCETAVPPRLAATPAGRR
jgi:hypothetical protein